VEVDAPPPPSEDEEVPFAKVFVFAAEQATSNDANPRPRTRDVMGTTLTNRTEFR